MIRLMQRMAFLAPVLLALGGVPHADADELQQSSYRASRAWSAGQALSILASFYAAPRMPDEESRALTALDEVVRSLGVPPPVRPSLAGREPADLEARVRFLTHGEGMRMIQAIRRGFGARAGALAELATRLRLLGAAWPEDVARFGTDLVADVGRLMPLAQLPERLFKGLTGAIEVGEAAPEFAVRVEGALRSIDTYLVWWGNDPTEADVRLVAWGFGIALAGVEAQAMQKGVTQEDQVLLLRFATRLGVHPPTLKLGRVSAGEEARAHITSMRQGYASIMLILLALQNGSRAAALTALAWRLAFPSGFCLNLNQLVVCAADLEAQMRRQELPRALWQPAVEALRRGAPKEEVEKRLQTLADGIQAHLQAAFEKRTSLQATAGPVLDPGYAKDASFRAALHLARATLTAARQPDDPEAAQSLQFAVDAADELGCIVPPPPEVRGERAGDLEAAVAYLRQGGAQLLGARIEQRAGPYGRAFFNAGLWSEMLRVFYAPGSERTRRMAAALQQALTSAGFLTEIWNAALKAVEQGLAPEAVAASLKDAQDEYGCQLSELCSGRAFEER